MSHSYLLELYFYVKTWVDSSCKPCNDKHDMEGKLFPINEQHEETTKWHYGTSTPLDIAMPIDLPVPEYHQFQKTAEPSHT